MPWGNPLCLQCRAVEERIRDADFASVYCLRNVNQFMGTPADPDQYGLGIIVHAAVQAYWQARRGGNKAPLKNLQQAAVATARACESFPFLLERNGVPANDERAKLGIEPGPGQKEGADPGLVEFVMANPAAWPEMAAAFSPSTSVHDNPGGRTPLSALFASLLRGYGVKCTDPNCRFCTPPAGPDFTKKPGATNGEPASGPLGSAHV